MEYIIKLHKDGDRMGVSTTLWDETEFLTGVASLLDNLIEEGRFADDWEFQLCGWLPAIVDVCCQIRDWKKTTASAPAYFCSGAVWLKDPNLLLIGSSFN